VEEILRAEGYLPNSIRTSMGLMAELSSWLDKRGLAAGDLSDEVIQSFFTTGGGHRFRRVSPRSLRGVVGHLRSIGVLGPEIVARPGRSDVEADLLAAFGTWCIDQRGLAPVTTDQYVEQMAGFLAMWHPHGEAVLSELDGASVLATIRAASIVMPAPSLRCMVTALRSFLRFAYVTGRVPAPLVTAVPSLKAWPRTALPSAIPTADARRLVDSCDTSTARGRRDAAVLLVLVLSLIHI